MRCGDSYDQSTKYKRGEIIGLDVEDLRNEISKAFQSTLNDHIKSILFRYGSPKNQPAVTVVEIEVERDWMFTLDNVYYFLKWSEKRQPLIMLLNKITFITNKIVTYSFLSLQQEQLLKRVDYMICTKYKKKSRKL